MHVRRALALTLAVPVLLAGCSDDPEPKPKIPETTSSSPTPTPTESETPEAESPEDFIRRWQAAATRCRRRGDGRVSSARSEVQAVRRRSPIKSTTIYDDGGSVEFAGSESRVDIERGCGSQPAHVRVD